MTAYIIRRLLQMIPILFGITFITFVIINAAGSPLDLSSSSTRGSSRRISSTSSASTARTQSHVTSAIFIWLGDVLRGDLGRFAGQLHARASDRILDVLPNTLLLSVLSVFFAVTIAIPARCLAAVKRNSVFDRVATIGRRRLCRADRLARPAAHHPLRGQVPGVGASRPCRSAASATCAAVAASRTAIEHLILPVAGADHSAVGGWMRLHPLLDARGDPAGLRAHRAGRRARERAVLYGHAFRNALLPLVTLVGLSMPELFAGALIVENVFAYPAWAG